MYPAGPNRGVSSPGAGPGGSHVRVSYRREPNFLQRLGGSFVGSLVGVVVVLGACALLFWNEGRGIHRYDMLLEAEGLCTELYIPDRVYESNDNHLIYVSGRISTEKPLEDTFYAVSKSAARLRRRVEMYQWIEDTEEREFREPDGTVRTERRYTYSAVWRDHVIDSGGFDDPSYRHNPTMMSVEVWEGMADVVKLGAYTLSKDAVLEMSNWHRLMLVPTQAEAQGLPVYNNMFYHGNPHSPQVGDMRVWFEFAGDTEWGHPDKVSIVARQSPGGLLSMFTTPRGFEILLVYMEGISMAEVFSREHSSNTVLTWGLRGAGWLLAVVGFNMVAGILVTLFDWVPLVRELLAIGVLVLCIVLATSLSLLIIALAWIRYRPLYGAAVLLGACLPFIASKYTQSKRKDA